MSKETPIRINLTWAGQFEVAVYRQDGFVEGWYREELRDAWRLAHRLSREMGWQGRVLVGDVRGVPARTLFGPRSIFRLVAP